MGKRTTPETPPVLAYNGFCAPALTLARQRRGLSQRQLARMIDAARLESTRVQINRWETGRIVPERESLEAVAEALGIEVSSLFA